MKENINSIYSSYFQDIYRFLLSLCRNHHTAEDLVQEVFIRAHLYIETYEGENVKTWLFTIAHHTFIDYYRKHKKMVIKDDSFFASFFDKTAGTEEGVLVQEEIVGIITILKDLPEKHRLAVLLHDFHQLSQQEASIIMNVKQSHFKVLLFRGRQAIRLGGEKENDR
jgi:RNA polymerase sigma-70 factor, ECF subfamily